MISFTCRFTRERIIDRTFYREQQQSLLRDGLQAAETGG
jgi:hypothetical protein